MFSSFVRTIEGEERKKEFSVSRRVQLLISFFRPSAPLFRLESQEEEEEEEEEEADPSLDILFFRFSPLLFFFQAHRRGWMDGKGGKRLVAFTAEERPAGRKILFRSLTEKKLLFLQQKEFTVWHTRLKNRKTISDKFAPYVSDFFLGGL